MIFGKSKSEILKSSQCEVFDIMKVGANISRLRKSAGLTQTELADRLNVSFQAVSNWERGQSCPDIANLMELASLFEVSVDRILGSERAAELVTDISEEKAPKMSAEEIKNFAPILDETQADSVVRKISWTTTRITRLRRKKAAVKTTRNRKASLPFRLRCCRI